MRGSFRILLAALAALLAGAGAPSPAPAAPPPDVVMVTFDCASGNIFCPAFERAVERTGVRSRILSPDVREDLVGTLSLLARQHHRLLIVDYLLTDQLAEVAPRFPDQAFGLMDAPLAAVDEDRSALGPHILTSVLKRYDRGLAVLMRQARDDRLALGRTTELGLRDGGTGLGRISPRVPIGVRRELAALRRRIVSGRLEVPGFRFP